MKTTRAFLIALSGLLAVSAARATTVIPPTFDQLVNEADMIVQGTVSEVKSQWVGEGGQRHIISYVTVQVEDALKGTPGKSVTLRMLGGTVDGETMEVSDAPKFQVGDRDILFVQDNGKQFIPLVGIMHGRFHVQKDEQTGAETILTNEGQAVTDLAKLGTADEAAAPGKSANAADATSSGKAIDASAFKAAIKAKLVRAGQ